MRVIKREHKYTQFELNAFERRPRKLFSECVFFHTQTLFYFKRESVSVYFHTGWSGTWFVVQVTVRRDKFL